MRYMAIVVLASLFVAMPVLANDAADTIFNSPSGAPPEATPNAPTWTPPVDAVVLYDQTTLITGNCPANVPPGSGSEVIPPLTSAGSNCNGALVPPFRVADDFTVPAGECWDIRAITVFAYQTGSSTQSTINWVDFDIWNGPPGAGGAVIYPVGAPPNSLTGSVWTTIYRYFNTQPCNATRPVMANVCVPPQPLQLGAGTYWLGWAARGTLASGPWAPYRTIAGQPTTGNARQLVRTPAPAWTNIEDPAGSGNFQGLCFLLEGQQCATSVEPATWGAIKSIYE